MLPDPVVLIEILSPSNEPKTRANIWAYTTIPTVAEIVVLRSTSVAAEVLRRQPDGEWPEQPGDRRCRRRASAGQHRVFAEPSAGVPDGGAGISGRYGSARRSGATAKCVENLDRNRSGRILSHHGERREIQHYPYPRTAAANPRQRGERGDYDLHQRGAAGCRPGVASAAT